MKNKFEVSTLILRVILGGSFFIHGLVKFQGGIENIAGWFDSIGLPGALAYVVAFVEMVGGLALIIGFGTRNEMPIIQITLLEGRAPKVVEQCIRNVAHTIHKSLGVPLSTIRVYVNEVPKNYYAVGDKLKSEKE